MKEIKFSVGCVGDHNVSRIMMECVRIASEGKPVYIIDPEGEIESIQMLSAPDGWAE